MKLIKTIGGILFIIGCILFILGLKVNKHHDWFLIPGIPLMAIGLTTFLIINRKEVKGAKEGYKAWREKLTTQGLKVEVDLDKVQVKHNQYREEIVKEGPSLTATALDVGLEFGLGYNNYQLFGLLEEQSQPKFKDLKQSVLVYETEVLGKKRKFFSPIILKDDVTIKFKLYDQKKTFIYADKLNENNYFFDIDFLKD